MKITNLTSQISFKKTLVANCSVIKKENDSFPCRIFCLDSTNDVDYFETVKNSQDWQKARYLCYLKEDLKTVEEDFDYDIFTLETHDGDCLGYSEIVKKDNNVNEVLFLETVPTQTFLNAQKAQFKYIGETLLSFMVKKSKKEKVKRIELHPSILSASFYKDKCFFIPPEKEVDPYHLSKNRFSKLINQNELHTHSSIELIG